MKKIELLFLLLFLALSVNGQVKERMLPLPTQAQLNWQGAELAVRVSYDLHVFDGVKYNQAYNRITPIPDINIFNPEQLDTDQWIRSVKAMGAGIAILTATHETGFALYQSDVNPYCMKALKWKDGKGDIVRDFVNSCRKYGVQPGIYIGIRWNSFLGVHDFIMPKDGTKFQENRQIFYNKMCEGMTEELMSRYGDLAIVWYDGGGHGPELGGADILPIVEKYQKNIIFYHNSQRADIRWGGSESGMVSYPCWGTFPFPYSHSKSQDIIFKDNFKLLKTGDPEGKYYMPAMSDAPLRGYNGRHEWFWEPGDDAHVFPLEHLMKMYYGSVGRNSTLILGVTPDDRGLLPDVDVARLKEFGDEIQRRFGNPIATTQGEGKRLQLKLPATIKINAIVIAEDIRQGERVRSYKVEGKVNGKWKTLATGSCIGHKRIEEIEPIEVSALRLQIGESLDLPVIAGFSVYSY
ncbi:alpha-L-fucosidase [Parabacteroides gordonii]|uniref:alpha-L-fucosidase n=1 Tax=Parabacteroides gordonii TaxID=574930 RepID=UPI000EE715D6|nr:alpha-L-fucosidase [Parabacteroides gordonii]RGP11159.1 glycoside hydrolase family 29 [Parabacteroides gordonii]